MEIGLEVWANDYAQVEATARRAESLGFDALAYGESPHDLNLDCWTVLGGLARMTERIRLGPVIANVLPTYRSTLLLARQAETVAGIAAAAGRPDRVELRTGVGASARHARPWWEPHGVSYPAYDRRLDDLVAALDVIEGRWGEQGGRLPVTIAATGERAMLLAARRANVWETSFCTAEEFAERRRRFERLLDGSRTVVRSLEIDGFVASTGGGVDRLLTRVRHERVAEDLDAVLSRALVGTPEEVAAHLAALADVGVERVTVALHDPHDVDALEALAHARSLATA